MAYVSTIPNPSALFETRALVEVGGVHARTLTLCVRAYELSILSCASGGDRQKHKWEELQHDSASESTATVWGRLIY